MNELTINIILFLSAFISGLVVILFKLQFSKNLKLLISFSGAFILAICVLHLMPEIFNDYDAKIGAFILLGFLIQLLLEFFSGGIEHGHFHSHKKDLAVFPYAIFISLCLHSFIEGMALVSGDHHHHLDYSDSLLIGIIIHKVPIAIVLSTMILSKNISKTTFIITLIIFASSAPLGLYLAGSHIAPFSENSRIILALAVGIFLHISTTILFESSEGHKFDLKKFIIIIIGFGLAIFTL
ncbi:MAG: ZIP family metal transporter [Flavobacteriales bacterium]|nr:ZIP family metal transporter [Flavobacteriales bacterium]